MGKHIKNKKRKKRKRLINLRKWCDRVTALRRVLIPCRVVAGRRYRHPAHKCPKPSCWWLPHKRRSDDPVVPDAPCIVVHQNIDYATAQVSDCDAHEHVGIWQEHCVDSLRGGGGGAAATRRKRDERALLEVLTKVLSDFAGTNSPAAPLHPKPPKPKPNSPRQDTLLDALKKIVQRAEKHPDQLLPKLTNLVSAANAGKVPLSSAEAAVPSASVPVGTKSKGAAKGKGKGAGKMTPESASPPADREQSANPASWVEVVNRRKKKPQSLTAEPQQQPDADFTANFAKGAKLKLWAPPSKPDAVTTVHALKAEIEAGRLPKASLVAANANTAVELQTLVKAHGLADKAAIAIAILYGEAPENAKKMWVHVQAAGGAPRAHKVPVVPLGAKLPDPPTTNVKTVEPPKELADTQVLRITIPHCFAGSRWKSARQRPANAILDLLHESQLVEGLVSTYGWKAVGDEVESVTGYIRATFDTIPKLLKLSGNRGIFFESLAKDRTNAPVEWIVQGPNEDEDTYFRRVSAESSLGLAFRRQGKSRLGQRLAPDAKPSDSNLAKVWEARGVPRDWSTGTLLAWLRANEWHEVELVAQPTKQRGWLFRAVNRDAVCFAYEVGNTICISISRFFHAAKAPKQSRIAYAGRRLSRDTEDAWSRDVGPKGTQKQSGPIPMETEETSDVPATALDDPSQKDSSEQPKRSSGQGNSPEKKRAKAEVVDDKSNDTLHSFTILDFGGDGDCAYRAGAAAYALAGNRPKAEVVKNAGQLGATLRAQITSHLRRHAIYESTFVPDSRWTPEREAGVVPSTYSEWIEATARPKRWIDGPCLATMATKLSRHLVIFQWRNERWERVAVLSPHQQCPKNVDEANKHPPMPLLLKDSHYRTLEPQESKPFPQEWIIPPAGISFDAGEARGAGKTCASSSAPSIKHAMKTSTSLKSWLPASSVASGSSGPKSLRSWLPPSTAAGKSNKASGSQAKVAKVAGKSLKSWLPASSGANAVSTRKAVCNKSSRGSATLASASAVHQSCKPAAKEKWFEDTSRTAVQPKPGQKFACDAPPKPIGRRKNLSKAGRPKSCRKVKTEAAIERPKAKRAKELKARQTAFFTWPCPACDAVFEGMYSSVIASKHHHWRSRHADLDRSLIMRQPPSVTEVSYVLPPDQQGWACPITGCDAALPALPRQDHKRAVAKHISDCHPGYTPRSLFALRAKIFKKPAVATMLTEKYAKQRAKLYKTHEIVKVVSPERLAKGERGNLYYCKRCLFQLKQDRHGGCHTCTQNLKRMKQKEVVTCQRRMWTNLKKNFPKHAANYAEAVGKTFAELDRVFQVRED